MGPATVPRELGKTDRRRGDRHAAQMSGLVVVLVRPYGPSIFFGGARLEGYRRDRETRHSIGMARFDSCGHVLHLKYRIAPSPLGGNAYSSPQMQVST